MNLLKAAPVTALVNPTRPQVHETKIRMRKKARFSAIQSASIRLGTFHAHFRPPRLNFQNLVYLQGRSVLPRIYWELAIAVRRKVQIAKRCMEVRALTRH
jgi:hypothetical protein